MIKPNSCHKSAVTLYKLLICQFSRQVWLANNKAFCKHAAATWMVNWSTMNAQLFNFHAAGLQLLVPHLAKMHGASNCWIKGDYLYSELYE